jgi:hypothetical protein
MRFWTLGAVVPCLVAGCGSSAPSALATALHHGQPVQLTFSGAFTARWNQPGTSGLSGNCVRGVIPVARGQPPPWGFEVDGTYHGEKVILGVFLIGFHGAGTYTIPQGSGPPEGITARNPAHTYAFIEFPDSIWSAGPGGQVEVDSGERAGQINVDLVESEPASLKSVHVEGRWACPPPVTPTPPPGS